MKLNLGCGYNKLENYVNVDHDINCKPDIVANLEELLPFADNSISEIILNHVLEHLGQDTKTYLNIWKEFYRILKNDGVIKIAVPHWNHDNFHHDPTHVRKVTPIGVDMFNQQRNMDTIKEHGQETTLGIQLGIDIEVTDVGYDFTPWFNQMIIGKPREYAEREMNRYTNTCLQVQIHAKAVKPPRSTL
jgi:ubiquinone/menaquinone biosynthesis C-methylase UbiE